MLKNINQYIVIIIIVFSQLTSFCQTDIAGNEEYKVNVQINVMVLMRDSIKLATDIYFPNYLKEKLPVILIRTPYGKQYRSAEHAILFSRYGYIVIVQDIRGKNESEGQFSILRNEGRDSYDTIEWIIKQPWSNGKIGTFGCSYPGESQLFLARLRHPNIVTMIAQSAGGGLGYACNRSSYFEFFEGGALRLDGALSWIMSYGVKDFKGTGENCYYPEMLRRLPVVDIVRKCGAVTDWEDFLSYSFTDLWWKEAGYFWKDDSIDIPVLHVNSWFDYGISETLCGFNLFKDNASNRLASNNQFLIISPARHCESEDATENTYVGDLNMGDARFNYWKFYLKWFDYWLKNVENGITKQESIQYYVMGKNRWRMEAKWPPDKVVYKPFYLHSRSSTRENNHQGSIDSVKPVAENSDHFTYDPENPTCNVELAKKTEWYSNSGVREDVLLYSSSKLQKGLEVTGPIKLNLYISSSAKDTDIISCLYDVFPDGSAYGIQKGILRVRYRNGFDKETFMNPGEIYFVEIDLHSTSYYFEKGHRFMIVISSSDFPNYDRNLNTVERNFFGTEWVIAKNTIYHSREYPSHILLPIIAE